MGRRPSSRCAWPGRFNVRNALAALAGGVRDRRDLGSAVSGLEAAEPVTGRMERIDLGQPFAVVVDYAHTTDALETVLHELRRTTLGRLWAVFGSAGERDVEKRAAMGAVAARLADISVITDEDPRGEDRALILEQIAAGAVAAGGDRGDESLRHPGPRGGDRLRGGERRCRGHRALRRQGSREDARDRGRRDPVERASRRDRGDPAPAQLIGCRLGVPGRARIIVGRRRDLADPQDAVRRCLRSAHRRTPTQRLRTPRAPTARRLTSAQRLPPMRSSGSASSQRTDGGAVAREVARSNALAHAAAAAGILGTHRLHLDADVRPSSPATWMRNPLLRRSASRRVTRDPAGGSR